METIQINDNIRLTCIGMTKLKTTSLGIYIHRPLRAEEASYNALLPLVLKRGSKLCPDQESAAKYLDGLYGATMGASVLKRGEDQIIYFDAETISDSYAPEGEKLLRALIKLLMSVVFDPFTENGAFSEKYTEQEKINACDRIDAFVNDKRQYASQRCQQETARGTDFAVMHYGDKDRIKSISAKALYEHYSSIITSSVIDIYICGAYDSEEAAKAVRAYTDSLSFTKAEIPRTEMIERTEQGVHEVTERMDVAQGKLAVGFLTNTPALSDDIYALAVFNSLFGAGAHSKLFNNVREKLSLAYYASSQLEKLKGIITVNAGIEFANFDKAYNETLAQLEEIRNGNISEHEFEASKIFILNLCNSYYDDQRALVSYYVSARIAGSDDTLEDYIEKIGRVSVEDVVRVSKKIQLDTVYFLTGKGEA